VNVANDDSTTAAGRLSQPTLIAYREIVMADAPMTVVETEEFLRKAKPLMSETEREELVAKTFA